MTLWVAGCTCVSSVEYEPMVGIGYDVGGEMACEFFFDCKWRGAAWADEAYAVADSKDMGIDGHLCFLEYDCLYDVGGLSSYARETFEFFTSRGYLPLVVGNETLCHTYEMT